VASLANDIAEWIRRNASAEAALQGALERALARFGAQGGTIHVLDGSVLRLAAWTKTIPEPVLEAVREVPIGKGMAGMAAQRREPVSTCDLQADNAGGVARPGAKQTGLRGSICIPMIGTDSVVRGTLGVGCADSREFSAAEIAELEAAGAAIADALARPR
jgi:GAF domain-containing protein